jgi:hypothetical protein
MEDWLYDEGEDCAKSVYVAKLEELKKVGGPIEARCAAVLGLRAAEPGGCGGLEEARGGKGAYW